MTELLGREAEREREILLDLHLTVGNPSVSLRVASVHAVSRSVGIPVSKNKPLGKTLYYPKCLFKAVVRTIRYQRSS